MFKVTVSVSYQGVDHKKEEIKQEVVQLVRTNVGALASFKEVHIVKKLPKTRSGKTARNTLAAMIAGQEYKVRRARLLHKKKHTTQNVFQ